MKHKTVQDSFIRLQTGRCPIHGIGMIQIGRFEKFPDGRERTEVKCPRKDCTISAWSEAQCGESIIIPYENY